MANKSDNCKLMKYVKMDKFMEDKQNDMVSAYKGEHVIVIYEGL